METARRLAGGTGRSPKAVGRAGARPCQCCEACSANPSRMQPSRRVRGGRNLLPHCLSEFSALLLGILAPHHFAFLGKPCGFSLRRHQPFATQPPPETRGGKLSRGPVLPQTWKIPTPARHPNGRRAAPVNGGAQKKRNALLMLPGPLSPAYPNFLKSRSIGWKRLWRSPMISSFIAMVRRGFRSARPV